MFAGPVKPADGQFVWTLFGLVAVAVALAAYLSLFPQDAGFLYFFIGIMFASSACTAAVSLRLKHHDYSPAAVLWLFATIALFPVCNLVVSRASLLSRWWSLGPPGSHFGVRAVSSL